MRQIRDAPGLSQNELIKRLGLDDVLYQSNISGFESGERELPLPILSKYAQPAGVCLDTLANDDLDLTAKLPSKPKHK